MSKYSKNQAFDEAVKWRSRLIKAGPDSEDEKLFQQWVEQSETHRQAYREAIQVWDEVAPLADQLLEEAKSLQIRRLGAYQWLFTPGLRWGAVAACCLILLFHFFVPVNNAEHYETAVSERREVALEDGSVLHINAKSSVFVDFSEGDRHVLLDSGEVYFEIAKDPERPFVVESGKAKITVLGTVFNVYKKRGDVSITTVEGLVSVEDTSSPGGPVPELSKGEQVLISEKNNSGSPMAIKKVDADQVTAWRRNILIFQDVSMTDFIYDINRYMDHKLVIGEAPLEALRLTGVIAINDREAILEDLKSAFNLKAVPINNDQTALFLSSKQSSE